MDIIVNGNSILNRSLRENFVYYCKVKGFYFEEKDRFTYELSFAHRVAKSDDHLGLDFDDLIEAERVVSIYGKPIIKGLVGDTVNISS